jgi:hypothetical protein
LGFGSKCHWFTIITVQEGIFDDVEHKRVSLLSKGRSVDKMLRNTPWIFVNMQSAIKMGKRENIVFQ